MAEAKIMEIRFEDPFEDFIFPVRPAIDQAWLSPSRAKLPLARPAEKLSPAFRRRVHRSLQAPKCKSEGVDEYENPPVDSMGNR